MLLVVMSRFALDTSTSAECDQATGPVSARRTPADCRAQSMSVTGPWVDQPLPPVRCAGHAPCSRAWLCDVFTNQNIGPCRHRDQVEQMFSTASLRNRCGDAVALSG